tara:strand:- start:15685 stop:16560 length:876 start_codon:yes stop_codon:yes gene_type:complete
MTTDWTKITHQMYYDWDEERRVLQEIQKCQRNWDYDKFNVNDNTYKLSIKELIWTAINAPTKQHEGYFDIYWTADRKVIQEISRYTWGQTHRRNPPSTWRNSQANASLYIIWVGKEPDSNHNAHGDGTKKENTDINRWHNAYVSIGISLGLTMRAAAKMGFATGCNKSHRDMNGDDFWGKKLGILDEIIDGKKQICYGLGVGHPQKNRPRWESDETELMIGSANGSRNSTTGQMRHPRTNKIMRQVEIVDIEKYAGNEMQDPYGNVHLIPDKAEFKINSFRERNIKVTEIK